MTRPSVIGCHFNIRPTTCCILADMCVFLALPDLSTYMPLARIRDEECPSEVRGIFDERDVIPWHRIYDFQLVSLKLLAEQLLLGCPGQVSQQSTDLFIPGELPLQKMALRRRIVVYASPHNPGALAVATDLATSMGDRLDVTVDSAVLTTTGKDGASGKHGERGAVFLLYLNDATFLHVAGETLAEELRTARVEGNTVEVLMVHENDTNRGACEFSNFFDGRTPRDLLQDGLFKVR
jgi:hypothetical protein